MVSRSPSCECLEKKLFWLIRQQSPSLINNNAMELVSFKYYPGSEVIHFLLATGNSDHTKFESIAWITAWLSVKILLFTIIPLILKNFMFFATS